MNSVNDRLWQAMRGDPTPRTVDQLARTSGGSRRAVQQRLRYWQNSGFVTRDEDRPPRYRLASPADCPAKPPTYSRTGTPVATRDPRVDVLWRAMRALSKQGSFDAPMIALIAETPRSYALNYMNRLRRAGFLRLVANNQPWRGEAAAFRLIRDTGPLPPRVDVRPGRRVVVDPNTGSRTDISPGRLSLRSKPAVVGPDGGVG